MNTKRVGVKELRQNLSAIRRGQRSGVHRRPLQDPRNPRAGAEAQRIQRRRTAKGNRRGEKTIHRAARAGEPEKRGACRAAENQPRKSGGYTVSSRRCIPPAAAARGNIIPETIRCHAARSHGCTPKRRRQRRKHQDAARRPSREFPRHVSFPFLALRARALAGLRSAPRCAAAGSAENNLAPHGSLRQIQTAARTYRARGSSPRVASP